MADVATQNTQGFDLGSAVFGTVNTGITSYFGYETAKEVSDATKKAPAANLGIVVGGVVIVAILLVYLVKH